MSTAYKRGFRAAWNLLELMNFNLITFMELWSCAYHDHGQVTSQHANPGVDVGGYGLSVFKWLGCMHYYQQSCMHTDFTVHKIQNILLSVYCLQTGIQGSLELTMHTIMTMECTIDL